MSDPVGGKSRLCHVPDELLAERAGDGDVVAFEVLAARHAPAMRAYARRLTGSLADADDVVQEALLQAWKHLDTLHDKAAVRAWLLRITGTRGIDTLRRRKYHPPGTALIDAPDPAPGPEGAAELNSEVAAISLALAVLPEEQRRCWAMKEIGGMSYEEIAHALNITPTSVRGRLARARAALLKTMEDWK
ncbi:RNA polymerase sigma factor [Pseudarthrobacter sp. AB1]|uniref:RNA polymerase sigma factor n=1 Tax=Pseudarthrobacter sp. AB1 TaxID=2138309 RepID=UPI00186B8DF8|nr:sigma-70 family RNA polymerase sigma factor [Pseudarthrobacter sp. AB1]MBE4720312.1 RNA polymerase subunit sigma-70 [Pseudarthrobacter sp. AB1]